MNKGKYNLICYLNILLNDIKTSSFSSHLKVSNLIHIPLPCEEKTNG